MKVGIFDFCQEKRSNYMELTEFIEQIAQLNMLFLAQSGTDARVVFPHQFRRLVQHGLTFRRERQRVGTPVRRGVAAAHVAQFGQGIHHFHSAERAIPMPWASSVSFICGFRRIRIMAEKRGGVIDHGSMTS